MNANDIEKEYQAYFSELIRAVSTYNCMEYGLSDDIREFNIKMKLYFQKWKTRTNEQEMAQVLDEIRSRQQKVRECVEKHGRKTLTKRKRKYGPRF